jgi:DNA-directed RNA polymerase specialized sigma24 family protein
LVDPWRNGDRSAFDEPVHRHREWALVAARTLVEDWESAEDSVQEAFVQAARGLLGLRDGTKLRAWLHVMGSG